jgi:hypothetical protein
MKKIIFFSLFLTIILCSLISAAQINNSQNSTLPENQTVAEITLPVNDTSSMTGFVIIAGEPISLYYLIPILFASMMIIILIILIVIARIINTNQKKHQIKPITSIQAQ